MIQIAMIQFVTFLIFCLMNVISWTYDVPPKLAEIRDSPPGNYSGMDIIVQANSNSGVLTTLREGDIFTQPWRRKRNAIRVSMWKWKYNVVPYVIEKSGISSYGLSVIQSAIDQYNSDQSCVKWRKRTTERDYVIIKDGAGCYSSIGRDTGPQDLVLGTSCYYKGVIMHEMNHAVGFFHEQSRYDRDDYILVNWENVQDDKTRDFTKQQKNIMDTLGTLYDYGSIMHYGATTFSKNGKPTLVPKFNTHGTMGQRSGFSEMDIWKIKKLYGCVNGDPPMPKWKQLEETSTSTMDQSTVFQHLTSDHATYSHSISTSSATEGTLLPTELLASRMTISTTHKPCPEETKLPNGIPGKVQDFQVVLIESTLRVFWSPPCTSVTLSGYMLTIKTGQQQSTILIAPNRQTHYIYTANHPGGRYEMTVTAFSPTGRGETSAPISTVSACGYDIVLPPNGIIHSLHSPYFLKKFYEPDVACQWNIRASEGQRLKVHFDAINLADNTLACMEDYVMINEDRFCRNVSTGGYYITNKTDAKIIFKSSLGITVKPGGFNISIEAIDVMPTVTQVVNSPGLIGLNWVPPESMKNTSYKYALKYRVLPELNQKVLRLGPSIHQFVIPTGGDIGRQYELELSIITKEEEGRPIKYTVRSACGHNVTVDHTGTIHNPPSFGSYQPDVLCDWYIAALQGQYFQLRISTLELESSQNCENDFLAINSQKYCNTSHIPVSALIFNDTVRVSFHSNGSVQRRGFSLRYEMV